MLATAYKAGVKIAFGTDTSTGTNAHEFALMVGAGMASTSSPTGRRGVAHPSTGGSRRRALG
jgi:hypothetical protein